MAFMSNLSLRMDYRQFAKDQTELSQLSAQDFPAFILFDDERWMNMSLYEAPSKRLLGEMDKLFERFQNPT